MEHLKAALHDLDARIGQARAELATILEMWPTDEDLEARRPEASDEGLRGVEESVARVTAELRTVQAKIARIREAIAPDDNEETQLDGSAELSARTEIRAALESAEATAGEALDVLSEAEELAHRGL